MQLPIQSKESPQHCDLLAGTSLEYIQTMCPGFNTETDINSDMRQSAIIKRECNKLNVDVASPQETRLAESGSLTESNYTFYWQDKPE